MAVLDPAPSIRLVITDLDNTLYDWVGWYARALDALVDAAQVVIGCAREGLLDELRDAYVQRGSVEEPRAVLDLPSVRRRFADPIEAAEALAPALEAWRGGRPRAYPGVARSLSRLQRAGVPVVGHTEAAPANAVQRLRWLGLESALAGLFAGPSHRPRADADVEAPEPLGAISPPPPFAVQQLGPTLGKPDPATVRTICERMDTDPAHVLYVGDNLERDVAMARRTGVWAAWSRFGTEHDAADWDRLIRVTHWTPAQVEKAEHPQPVPGAEPHAILDASFDEIFVHFAFEPLTTADAESA